MINKIYYCVADTYQAAANSPHIEGLKSKGKRFYYLTDRIDEWLMTGLIEYKGKELVNAAKEEITKRKEKSFRVRSRLVSKIKKHLDRRFLRLLVSSD